tara:strand:- start:381 stop:1022 length:642 start_codon:yes stop_codon:yes gene_type:complete
MAITINGSSNSITGLANGGLPDGCILDADINGMAASKLTGALPAISGASLTGISAGITMVDNWYINSAINVGSGTNTLNANWERGTSAAFGSIGSAMTQSSGLFAFPSTGIYYCSINGNMYRGTGYRRYVGFTIQTTADNGSSYFTATSNYDSISGDTNSNVYAHMTSTFVFDVTDTSTHKMRFQTEAVDSGNAITDVGGRYLNVLFMRLGDT